MTHVGISDVRIEIVRRLREAVDKAHAARSQKGQRYQRGRADGLGEALQLVDAFLRSEDEGKPVEPREVAEIVTAVESIVEGQLRRSSRSVHPFRPTAVVAWRDRMGRDRLGRE